MENQEKNQKGNQEYSQERKQEHKQNNGLELLKKVIETNERNTGQGIKTEFVYEDLLNIKGETESTMRGFNATILKLSENIAKELLKATYASSPEDELLKKKKRKFR